MRAPSNFRPYWPALAAILLFLSWYNFQERKALLVQVNAAADLAKQNMEEIGQAYARTQSLLGRPLKGPSELIFAPSQKENAAASYRVVAFLSGNECNQPRSLLTEFLKQLAFSPSETWIPGKAMIAVVGGEDLVAKSYRNTHGFDFPVVADADGRFLSGNGLTGEPIALILDRFNRVVMAASPSGRGATFWSAFRVGAISTVGARRETIQQ